MKNVGAGFVSAPNKIIANKNIVFWILNFHEKILKNIVKKYKIKYNKNILFIKENFVKGGVNLMTSYELIWRLIVLLLLNNNNNESQDKNKD